MDASHASPRFRVLPSLLTELRRRFGRLLVLSLLIVVPLLFFRACAIKYIAPDEIGLRQISFGPAKGLQKEVVQPGYRRQIASYETIQTFPRDLQVVEFTNNAIETTKKHRTLPAVNCPTVDGYPVNVDVTVVYRLADPFAVVSRFGFGRAYEDSVVIRFTDPAIKHYLGELRAEEFYRDARDQKVARMKADLAARFHENGLDLADVLIRQYDYPNTFQALTEQKKIQDQSVLTNRALAKQAEVQTRLNQVMAQGKNMVNVRTAEVEAQITGINADRDLYIRQKHAEADLLVKTAEANGTEMINRAMEGAGSDKLLRLRKGLALLNGIRGPIYISGDPTDVVGFSRNH
jgi:regulator of protease activity HflC (stomatin/prohibitin superfamily)